MKHNNINGIKCNVKNIFTNTEKSIKSKESSKGNFSSTTDTVHRENGLWLF